MTNFKSFIIGLIFIFISLVLFYKAPYIDSIFSTEKKASLPSPTEALAIITNSSFKFPVKVSIKRFSTGNVDIFSSNKLIDTPLFHRDKIFFRPNGSVTIKFNSNYEVDLSSKNNSSETYFELNDVKDVNSAVYMTLASGTFDVLKPGSKGKLYIIKDQKISTPERFREDSPKILTIASHPVLPKVTTTKSIETSTDLENSKYKSEKSDDNFSVNNIENAIRSQSELFQKCQTNSMRSATDSSGKLLIEFSVQSSGSITQLKIIESSLKDKKLEECSLSVIRRLSFAKFDGDPLTFSYPIEYK